MNSLKILLLGLVLSTAAEHITLVILAKDLSSFRRESPVVQSPSKLITLKEFLKLPETKPASEYMDGQIIQKPMPQGKHSTIQTEFSPIANSILKPRKVARAFSELRCTYPAGSRSSVYGGRSTVPDVSVFTWERILRDQNGEVANAFLIFPDWTIEILS